MVLQSASNTSSIFCDLSTKRKNPLFSSISNSSHSCFCPCTTSTTTTTRRKRERIILKNVRWVLLQAQGCINGGNTQQQINAATRRGAKNIVLKQFSDEDNLDYASSSGIGVNNNNSNYYSSSFGQDPIVDKLRTQLGVIHPIPSPPINRSVFGLFGFFFFVGVVFDKLLSSRKRNTYTSGGDGKRGSWPQVPTSLSMFLEKDLQRKESVEWVNMVLGKLWKVYRGGIENWIIGVLQPVIDNLKKPDYVERVEIKQFSLGNEPLSVRSVERKTSRRVNDLQYQIGIRYTGGARMLLMLSLKFGILPIVVPVGVRDFDIDGELWVKLRLIPTEPWVGAVSWAFVSLPKIKFELSPFRVFNLMAIPVLSMFLKKLLTEDLPRLFVRPKKIVLHFQKGKTVGPVPNDSKTGEIKEGNTNFAGELSVTLLDARKLSYIFYGKTDPYVILRLGDQVIRSKRNSQTTVIGPPGEPIWNQDFHMLVANPRKEKLSIEVKDSLGFTDLTVGTAEVDLGSLKDTVPADRIVVLRGGWSLFGKGSCGEILLRLTYKAYVEDEEDEKVSIEDVEKVSDSKEKEDDVEGYLIEQSDKESSFVDVLSALLVSEEFRGIVTSETLNNNNITKSIDDDKNGVDSPEESNGNNNNITKSIDDDKNGVDSPEESNVPTTTTTTSVESGGSTTLFWLALITSISVLIAINMGGSSLFNP